MILWPRIYLATKERFLQLSITFKHIQEARRLACRMLRSASYKVSGRELVLVSEKAVPRPLKHGKACVDMVVPRLYLHP